MITIKTREEIEIIREGGKLLSQIMDSIEKEVRPDITTDYLNKVAKDLVFKVNAKPSFLGYDNFPAVICASVNEEVVHCPPSERKLKNGDIIVIDIGIEYKGFHTDMAKTIAVGTADFEALRLIKATKQALHLGIIKAKVGNTFGDIGNTIQRYIESQNFNVVRDLCGHGIGKKLHEDPEIPNYGKRGSGPRIKEGMVFCIEPITTMGKWEIVKDKSTGGYKTKDGSLSAHFEHTIAIINGSPEILTK